MNPQDPFQEPLPKKPVHNPLSVMQPGEQMICTIKRHPIGLIVTGLVTVVLLFGLGIVLFAVVPNVVTNLGRNEVLSLAAILFFLVTLLCLGFMFIASKVYWGNHWILTSDSITQINQRGLFNKESSQLSLGNLEDVTVVQQGLLPNMFNYGTLKAETAGERGKFVFQYCPNPNHYAQKVLACRERFEQERRHAEGSPQRLYRDEGAYASQPAWQAAQPPASTVPQMSTGPSSSTGYLVPDGNDRPADDQGVNINME